MDYINTYKLMLVKEDTTIPQENVKSSRAVVDLMISEYHMDKLPVEEMLAIFTNVKCDIIGIHLVSKGGLSSSSLDPRSIFAPALLTNAAGIILVHNHPSGHPEPSTYDDLLTKTLCDGAKLLGLRIVDHVIISSSDAYYSFAENGKINND